MREARQHHLRLCRLARAGDAQAAFELLKHAPRWNEPDSLALACSLLPPTPSVWSELCAHAARFPLDVELERTGHIVDAWPAALREMPAAWIEALLDGRKRPWFRLVGRLDLTWRYFEAHIFSATPQLAGLRELALTDCDLGPTAADAVGAATWLRQLKRLDLGGNRIGDRGARTLACAEHLQGLVALDLDANVLTNKGLAALLDSPLATGLRTLSLSNNPITDQGARMLAESPLFAQLDELDIHRCCIGDEGIEAIVEAARTSTMRVLQLAGNPIGHTARDAIRSLRRRGWTEVRG